MKYLGLDNRTYIINISDYLNKPLYKSKLHLKVRELIKSYYGLSKTLEEVSIKGFPRGKTLYLDFFIPNLKLVIEANGNQHTEHVGYFHSNKAKFLLAQNNDRLKKEWAELNGFKFIELFWNETEDEWRKKLCG